MTEGEPEDVIAMSKRGRHEKHPATILKSALAFDPLGNLFVADRSTGDILEFTPAGVQSVFASGLPSPRFLAFGPPSVLDGGRTLTLLGISVFALLCVRQIGKATRVSRIRES